MWIVSISVLTLWTIWHFFIYPGLKPQNDFDQVKDSNHKNVNNNDKLLLETSTQENLKSKLNNCNQNGRIHENLNLKKEKSKKYKKYI
jgi:hypothetical protein